MSKFDSGNGDLQKFKGGHFGFSAAKIDNLGASEYTLVTFVVDRSGSTSGFQNDMEQAIKAIIEGCNSPGNPRKDNLLIRLITFDSDHQEVHGYRLLSQCDLGDYDGVCSPGGMTALFDAVVDALEAKALYGKELNEQDYDVNGFLVVMTDGWENASKLNPSGSGQPPNPKYVKEALNACLKQEHLESLLSVLIGINAGDASAELDSFRQDVGFDQYANLEDLTPEGFAKMVNWVVSSVSSQSSQIGSGQASQPIEPTF